MNVANIAVITWTKASLSIKGPGTKNNLDYDVHSTD